MPKKEYDFSESLPNPYVRREKKQVTLRLAVDVIDHFKRMAEETGLPYQNLINLYLQECAQSQKRLQMEWRRQSPSRQHAHQPPLRSCSMIPELEEEIMADESFLEELRQTREKLYQKAGGTMQD